MSYTSLFWFEYFTDVALNDKGILKHLLKQIEKYGFSTVSMNLYFSFSFIMSFLPQGSSEDDYGTSVRCF